MVLVLISHTKRPYVAEYRLYDPSNRGTSTPHTLGFWKLLPGIIYIHNMLSIPTHLGICTHSIHHDVH